MRPPLDQYLAADCAELTVPTVLDYDAWQDWVLSTVLPAYGDCAIRHRKTVDTWPK